MKITFSDHALRQLKERLIPKKLTVKAVELPDKKVCQETGRIKYLKKIIKGNKKFLLVVIIEGMASEKKIITAFITSKVKKYL